MSDTIRFFVSSFQFYAGSWTLVITAAVIVVVFSAAGLWAYRRFPKLGNNLLGGIVGIFAALGLFHFCCNLEAGFEIYRSFCRSALDTLKVFVLETGFNEYIAKRTNGTEWFWTALYIAAPTLTATALLVSVREFFHLTHIGLSRLFGMHDIYVFSELNEKSITLAKSIYDNHTPEDKWIYRIYKKLKNSQTKKQNKQQTDDGDAHHMRRHIRIYFCDVFRDNTENYFELKERADKIHALCLRHDIASANFTSPRIRNLLKRKVNYFLIGVDENENIYQAGTILDKFYKIDEHDVKADKQARDEKKKSAATYEDNMYLFTTFENAYTLLNTPKSFPHIRVRIKNEVEAFTLNHAFQEGTDILQCAVKKTVEACEWEKNKATGEMTKTTVQRTVNELNVLIVGLGLHGREMTKLLCWLCQLEGYTVKIHVFDVDKETEAEFRAECPKLMTKANDAAETGVTEETNKPPASIGAEFEVTLHCEEKYNALSESFYDALRDIYNTRAPQYVFVSLGNDNTNISVAGRINRFFEQQCRCLTDRNKSEKAQWLIEAVVYNSSLSETFDINGNNIHYIGSIRYTYSEAVIMQSALEENAKKVHLGYADNETSFWADHYNYRSSVSTVIFAEMWKKLYQANIMADHHTVTEHIQEYRACLSDASQQLLAEVESIPGSDTFAAFTKLVEHRRWNVYMLTEGFIPVASKEQKSIPYRLHHQIREFIDIDELNNESAPKFYNEYYAAVSEQEEQKNKAKQ